MRDGKDRATRVSKTLSLWLRHDPGAGGLRLGAEGWVPVEDVLAALAQRFTPPVTREELERVVDTSDKKRFAIERDRIRANQGHSVEGVEIRFEPVEPPDALYHGTTRERWGLIRRSGGLSRMKRHHVHLSADVATARAVGSRHRREQLVVLRVDAAAMRRAGHAFFVSANGVFLTDSVPAKFLSESED